MDMASKEKDRLEVNQRNRRKLTKEILETQKKNKEQNFDI